MDLDLTGYNMSLDSLINRHIFLLVVDAILIISGILLSWILPYIDSEIKKKKSKPKTKIKAEIIKKKKRNTLIIQVVLTAICLVAGIYVIKDDAERLNDLRIDANSNSISVYEGEADLLSSVDIRRGNFSEWFVDYRSVTFEDSDEIYWIDMSEIDEGWVEDWGKFSGKIVYGENSKVILKIE